MEFFKRLCDKIYVDKLLQYLTHSESQIIIAILFINILSVPCKFFMILFYFFPAGASIAPGSWSVLHTYIHFELSIVVSM